ncbi:MAG: hypothetical protein WD136_06510 [Cyanobium sp.]
MIRSSLARIAASAFGTTALLLGAPVLLGTPGLAQTGAAPAAAAKPVSLETMNDLALAAAVNVCELAVEQKLAVQDAVVSNAKAIAYVVTAAHGGQIAGAGKLDASQIVNGTIVQIVGRVKQGCYPKITAADKKFVDDVIAQFTAQAKQQPKK